MTDTFTFKTSRLMSIRLWFARQEIKRKVSNLNRKPKAVYLIFINSLVCKVIDLIDEHPTEFYSPIKTNLPFDTSDLLLLHYKLTIEQRHYSRLRSIEQRKSQRLINRSNRLMPSWVRVPELRNESREYYKKSNWKDNWIDKNGIGWWDGFSIDPLDDAVLIFVGGFITSVILALFLPLMIYKDQLFSSLIQLMVDESIRYQVDFPTVYAAFGVAIIIIMYMFVTIFVILKRWSQSKQDLSQGLADIAHTLEHDVVPADEAAAKSA